MVFANIQTIQPNKTQTLAYSKNLYSQKEEKSLELFYSVNQDGKKLNKKFRNSC